MKNSWKTRLTELGIADVVAATTSSAEPRTTPLCQVPIVGAPMAGHAGGALAAEVCRAGGLGFIGCGHYMIQPNGLLQMQEQIDIFRSAEDQHRLLRRDTSTTARYPLCLGLIGYLAFGTESGWDQYLQILQSHKPDVVQFTAPAVTMHAVHGSNVALAQQHGAKVFAQVGTVREAMEAMSAGVDGLIVQGLEAGGHGLRREHGNGVLSLAATVISQIREQGGSNEIDRPSSWISIPVIAAGGIADGRTMAAAMALGCDGVVLGTRLCASVESTTRQKFKEQLIATPSCDDVVRTTTFDWIQNSYSNYPWPPPYDSVGALRNVMSETWEGRPTELQAAILEDRNNNNKDDGTSWIDNFRRACDEETVDQAVVLAGEGVGLLNAIEPAYDIVTNIGNDAATIIRTLSQQLLP